MTGSKATHQEFSLTRILNRSLKLNIFVALIVKMDNQLESHLKLFDFAGVKDEKLDEKEVRARYHKSAKTNHPDKEGGSNEIFQNIQNAYRRIVNFLCKLISRRNIFCLIMKSCPYW